MLIEFLLTKLFGILTEKMTMTNCGDRNGGLHNTKLNFERRFYIIYDSVEQKV